MLHVQVESLLVVAMQIYDQKVKIELNFEKKLQPPEIAIMSLKKRAVHLFSREKVPMCSRSICAI